MKVHLYAQRTICVKNERGIKCGPDHVKNVKNYVNYKLKGIKTSSQL